MLRTTEAQVMLRPAADYPNVASSEQMQMSQASSLQPTGAKPLTAVIAGAAAVH